MEETFTGGSKTPKFVHVFSLKSFVLYSIQNKSNNRWDASLHINFVAICMIYCWSYVRNVIFTFDFKVRFYYYRTWHKVEPHLDPAHQVGKFAVLYTWCMCILFVLHVMVAYNTMQYNFFLKAC